jgi:hypothetical protein
MVYTLIKPLGAPVAGFLLVIVASPVVSISNKLGEQL